MRCAEHLLLIVCVFGIIDGVVQPAALFALDGLAGDEIADVDHVAEFADVLGGFDPLEEFFGLFVEQVETCPGTFEAEVAAYNAYVVRHDLTYFFLVLRNEHFFFVGHGAVVVPFRDGVVESVGVDMADGVGCCFVGIDYGLDEGVARQTVAAMQTRARTFADGVEPADAGAGVEVHFDAAAHVVGAGNYGDVLFGDVDADAEAFGVDVGEVVAGLLGVLVRHVETYVVEAVHLHFPVDGTCHDVTRVRG
jgi:hypothetical protein